jgi:hypothetical protein
MGGLIGMGSIKAQLKKGLLGIFGRAARVAGGKKLEAKPVASASPPAKSAPARAPVKAKSKRKAPTLTKEQALEKLLGAFAQHPRRQELARAGQEKDQLLRSLIPLYVAQSLEIDVSSVAISRFWKEQGVKYAGPNAAKALRQHVGYARNTAVGRQITPNGVKYVEAALAKAS